jgi:hypothetical protein
MATPDPHSDLLSERRKGHFVGRHYIRSLTVKGYVSLGREIEGERSFDRPARRQN